MRIFLLIAELNNLDTCQEKIWTRAGPEFGQYECKVFIIVMALYGLKYNGSEFMEFLAGNWAIWDSIKVLQIRMYRSGLRPKQKVNSITSLFWCM